MVNPAHRTLDGQVYANAGKRHRRLTQFGALNLSPGIEPALRKKADLQEQIEQAEVQTRKDTRKATARHIDVNDLPEDQRFRQLCPHSKHCIDTIEIIVYRAETSMDKVLRETMPHPDESRSLPCAVYTTEVDLLADTEHKTLTVRLQPMAQRAADTAIRKLWDELNATESLFPRPDLRLVYALRTK